MASVAVHGELALPYLYRYGSPELQDRYLPGMMTGELIGALAVSEPDAGSRRGGHEDPSGPRW